MPGFHEIHTLPPNVSKRAGKGKLSFSDRRLALRVLRLTRSSWSEGRLVNCSLRISVCLRKIISLRPVRAPRPAEDGKNRETRKLAG